MWNFNKINNFSGWFVDDVMVYSDDPYWAQASPKEGTISSGSALG